MSRPILVFDVNETLLDVRSMAPQFEATFGNASVLREWFSDLLRFSLEVSVTGDYLPFDELARSALTTTAARQGRELSAEDSNALLSLMTQLPAHADSAAGLSMLKEAGFIIAALTNSRHQTALTQLTFAGLVTAFDHISVSYTHLTLPTICSV